MKRRRVPMGAEDDLDLIFEDEIETPTELEARLKERLMREKAQEEQRTNQKRRAEAEITVLKAIVRGGVYWPGD